MNNKWMKFGTEISYRRAVNMPQLLIDHRIKKAILTPDEEQLFNLIYQQAMEKAPEQYQWTREFTQTKTDALIAAVGKKRFLKIFLEPVCILGAPIWWLLFNICFSMLLSIILIYGLHQQPLSLWFPILLQVAGALCYQLYKKKIIYNNTLEIRRNGIKLL